MENKICILIPTRKRLVDFKIFADSWIRTTEGKSVVVVTKGKEGAILNNEHIFPIEQEHDVRDLSGAGDTFLAALVAKYIENYDICEAVRFANKCAAWVVTQKGVVVLDLNKIKL